MHSKRREASQPWYGSSMKAQHRSEINGEPVRRPARPARPPDAGLYRYVPVPPVYRDEDGYLVEDGMSQNYTHQRQTAFWCIALRRYLPATATVCTDLPLHYRLDDMDAALVPDLFVALQAPPREGRRSYKLWLEPLPELAMELLSKSTSQVDVRSKLRTYAYIGVREYWLFDPNGIELPTPLAGYQLREGRYQRIAADPAGRLRSEVLGLDLHVHAGELQFRDPETGKDLRTYDEAEDERLAAERRADAAEYNAGAERSRADAAENRADAEKDRADAERARADAAESRAEAAEQELARLRLRFQQP